MTSNRNDLVKDVVYDTVARYSGLKIKAKR